MSSHSGKTGGNGNSAKPTGKPPNPTGNRPKTAYKRPNHAGSRAKSAVNHANTHVNDNDLGSSGEDEDDFPDPHDRGLNPFADMDTLPPDPVTKIDPPCSGGFKSKKEAVL